MMRPRRAMEADELWKSLRDSHSSHSADGDES